MPLCSNPKQLESRNVLDGFIIIEFTFNHEKLEQLNTRNKAPPVVSVEIEEFDGSPITEDPSYDPLIPFKEMNFDTSGSFFVTVRVTDMLPVALYHPESEDEENDGYFLPIAKDSIQVMKDFEKMTLDIMLTGENMRAADHIASDFVRFKPFVDKFLPEDDVQPNNLIFDYDTAKYFSRLSTKPFKDIVDYKDESSINYEFLLDLSPLKMGYTSQTTSTSSTVSKPLSIATILTSLLSSQQNTPNLSDVSKSPPTTAVDSDSELLAQLKQIDELKFKDSDSDRFNEESLYYKRISPAILKYSVPGTEAVKVQQRVIAKKQTTEEAFEFDPKVTANHFQAIRPFLVEPINTNKALLVMIVLQVTVASLSLSLQPEKGYKFFSPLLQSPPLLIEQGHSYDFRDEFFNLTTDQIFFNNLQHYSTFPQENKIGKLETPVYFELERLEKEDSDFSYVKAEEGERQSFEISFTRTKMPSGSPAPDLLNTLMMNHTRKILFNDSKFPFFQVYYTNLELEISVPKGMTEAFKATMPASLVPSDPSEMFGDFTNLDFIVSSQNISVPDYSRRILEAQPNTCKLMI